MVKHPPKNNIIPCPRCGIRIPPRKLDSHNCANAPCIHLGDKIRENGKTKAVECQACPTSNAKPKKAIVYQCGIHGECTLYNAVGGMHACKCESYIAIDTGKVQWRPVVDEFEPSERAIVTIATGDMQLIEPWILPRMESYAAKVGAKLIYLKNKTQSWWGLEKFRTYEIAKVCRQTLFLDFDVIIQPSCPDLFYMHDIGRVLMHDDWPAIQALPNDPEWIEGLKREISGSQGGEYVNRGRCLNTGVVCCDRSNADAWKPPEHAFKPSHCAEQAIVDNQVGDRWQPLETTYNREWWMADFNETWRESHVVHLASCRDRLAWLTENLPLVDSPENHKA